MSTTTKKTEPETIEDAVKALIRILGYRVEQIATIEITRSRVRVITKDRSLTSRTIEPIGDDDE